MLCGIWGSDGGKYEVYLWNMAPCSRADYTYESGNLLPPATELPYKWGAARASETPVNNYQTIQRHIPEDNNLRSIIGCGSTISIEVQVLSE
jgi:hypothetical protein